MDRIRITGGNELNGIIPISGAKNAALPLMIASLMTSDTLTLENVPHLADVEQLIRILGNHGVDISVNGRRESQGEGYSRTVHFTCRTIVDTTAPYELVSKMRASFWVIGPLLARNGQARVSLPGGCAIGTRPVDLFIEGLEALGNRRRLYQCHGSIRRSYRRDLHIPESLGRRNACDVDGSIAGTRDHRHSQRSA
jgi:UDP-N-acetylglucosamine 1-carboxyvinyltransferase